jgi:hypothetical protein
LDSRESKRLGLGKTMEIFPIPTHHTCVGWVSTNEDQGKTLNLVLVCKCITTAGIKRDKEVAGDEKITVLSAYLFIFTWLQSSVVQSQLPVPFFLILILNISILAHPKKLC